MNYSTSKYLTRSARRKAEESSSRLTTEKNKKIRVDYASVRSSAVGVSLSVPPGFSLAQSICSYGYFGLSPNLWEPAPFSKSEDRGVYSRPLVYGSKNDHVVMVAVSQPEPRKVFVEYINGRHPTSSKEVEEVMDQVARVLRLDMSSIDGFHRVNSLARKRGFGRTFRSPTLFEDMVKTITNCNVKWSGTVRMNRLLCQELGFKCGTSFSFPTPDQVVRCSVDSLKHRCRLGYRSRWVLSLAEKFVRSELDAVAIEEEKDAATIQKLLLGLKGFGVFASFNVMQLLGHFEAFPFDTETVRLFKEKKFCPNSTAAKEVFELAKAHYDKYKPYQFLAYWFDLWQDYEARKGLISTRWQISQCKEL